MVWLFLPNRPVMMFGTGTRFGFSIFLVGGFDIRLVLPAIRTGTIGSKPFVATICIFVVDIFSYRGVGSFDRFLSRAGRIL